MIDQIHFFNNTTLDYLGFIVFGINLFLLKYVALKLTSHTVFL